MRDEDLKKEIIEILASDASKKADDIAAMLNRPEKEIAEYIKSLEKDKTILAYRAVVNRQKYEPKKTQCFIEVQCSPQRGVGFDSIAKRIYKFPEVKSLFLISGGFDLLLLVEGETMKDIAFFVAEKLATLDHVKSTSTHFLLKRYKEDGFILEDDTPSPRLAVTP